MHWVRRLSACSALAGSLLFACRLRHRRCRRRVPDPFDLGHPRRMARGRWISSAPRSIPSPRLRPPSPLPASGACRLGSALDAGAGATERDHVADLSRDRTQSGPGAVAVRYRRLSRCPPTARRLSVSRYQADFRPADLFHAGAAGYNAVFSLRAGRGRRHAAADFARPVEVQITGSILTYDLADPLGGKGEPVKALAAQYPDLRRFIREGYVRYAFTRFGVPYVVSIQCLDSAPRSRRLACREAYPVAEHFLKALRIAGGQPSRPRRDIRPRLPSGRAWLRPTSPIARAATSSPTAARASAAAVPISRSIRRSGFRWKKRRPSSARNPSAGKNREENAAYPWQDNFCEARSFQVGQCAAGFGHQGQDIRPAPARRTEQRKQLRSEAAGRRRGPRRRRDPFTEAAGGDAAGQHPQRAHPLSLHAHEPVSLDADGMLNGRRSPKAKKSAWSRTISISQRHLAASAFRRAGVHARRLDLGQSLHHADLVL